MKILYHMPSLGTLSAHRTIYNGFKNAFTDLGNEFRPLSSGDNFSEILETFRPDLFITASHYYYRKYIDFDLLKKYREQGLFVLVKIDFWNSPISAWRINEAPSLSKDVHLLRLMDSGKLGDAFFHVVEQDDARMDGFQKETGLSFFTIPLAADKVSLKPEYREKFSADISYVGTSLPEKRKFFNKYVFPFSKKHNLRIYGQDWNLADRYLGVVQKAGQFFNIGPVSRIRKPKLDIEDEAFIYSSSKISINVHEEYQKEYGGDCNERTFKIPLCGGFEVVDNVACIKKYFEPNKEIIIARDGLEWVDLIEYYLNNPEKRLKIIQAGRYRALKDHTYHNRAKQMIDIKNGINK